MIYLILLAGLILRLVNLNQSLWLDEAITALTVKNNTLVEIITNFARGDFHPPLYYLILKLWSYVFGFSEVALRFPSVVFGVLTIFYVYKIGGKKFGLVAGLLMALNPLAVYYSQEARMYSLAAFCVTAAVYYFSLKKWFLWGVFLLIGLYSDYVVWFILPVFFILKRRSIVVSLFLVPLLPLLKEQLFTGLQTVSANPLWGQVVGGLDPKAVPLTIIKFIFGRVSLDNKLLYGAVFGGIATAYLWLISNAKNKVHWLWLGVPILTGFLISFKVPIYSYFRFLFVLPAFILLVAEGAKNHKLKICLLCFISLISLIWFNSNQKFHREDWRATVNYVRASGNKVYMPSIAQDAALKYYGPNIAVNDRNSIVIGQDKTVFLLRYVQEIFDERDFLKRVLEATGYHKTEERNFNGVVVWKYEL